MRYRRGMAMAIEQNCEIYYESFGDPADPTLLLVNGLGSQCINYHEDWCEMFVARGLRVVRFDNRDVGLSSKFDDAPVDGERRPPTRSPTWPPTRSPCSTRRRRAGPCDGPVDGRDDRAAAGDRAPRSAAVDDVGDVAHRRAGYGESTPEAFALLTAPPATDRESYIASHIAGLRVWGSPAFADEDRWRRDAERAFDRSFHPSGTGRQFRAVGAVGSRADRLREVTTPTLVMHGDSRHADRHQRRPAHRRTDPRRAIRAIEGMGHDYPPQLWDRWVDLVSTVRRSVSQSAS